MLPTEDYTSNDPVFGIPTHLLPTPTILTGLPGPQKHNRGITPRSAYKKFLPRKQTPLRRLSRKVIAMLKQHSADLDEIAVAVAALQRSGS